MADTGDSGDQRPRKGPRDLLPLSEKKKRKAEGNRRGNISRISIGDEIARWIAIRVALNIPSNAEFARVLLDSYHASGQGQPSELQTVMSPSSSSTDTASESEEPFPGEIGLPLSRAKEDQAHTEQSTTFVKGSTLIAPSQLSDKIATDNGSRIAKMGTYTHSSFPDSTALNLGGGIAKESSSDYAVTRDMKTCKTDASSDAVVLKMEVEVDGYDPGAAVREEGEVKCFDKRDSVTDLCDSRDSEMRNCQENEHSGSETDECENDSEIESVEINECGGMQTNGSNVGDSDAADSKVRANNQFGRGQCCRKKRKRIGEVDSEDDPDYVASDLSEFEYKTDNSLDSDEEEVKKAKVKKKENVVRQVRVKKPKPKKKKESVKKPKREKKGRTPYKERKISELYYRLDDERCTITSVKFKPYLEAFHEYASESPEKRREGLSGASSLSSHLDSSEQPTQSQGRGDRIATEAREGLETGGASGDQSRVVYKYRCKICGYTSKSLSVVRGHISKVEFYEPTMCSDCGEMLPNANQLYIHRKSKHDTIQSHVCTYEGCSYRSDKITLVKKHVATVHENKREYPCTWEGCGKWFKKPYALRIHMRIHSDEKPVVCYLCGFCCRQKASLNWHMKTKHPDKP